MSYIFLDMLKTQCYNGRIQSFIHSFMFICNIPMYNVDRIMRNTGQKGRARPDNCPEIKTTLCT